MSGTVAGALWNPADQSILSPMRSLPGFSEEPRADLYE
jgi:hypothetical protein